MDYIPEMKVSRDGIFREVEVGVVMTPEHVKELIEFLQGRLEYVEKIKAAKGGKEESGRSRK